MPPIKTQARAATILPNFVGLIFQVHNGKSYTDVRITEDMVGHKLGEFSAYVRFCRRITKDKSDNQQHPKTLHVQADEEQVKGEIGLHGNGASASLDDYTTGENSVKYLYVMALGLRNQQQPKKGRNQGVLQRQNLSAKPDTRPGVCCRLATSVVVFTGRRSRRKGRVRFAMISAWRASVDTRTGLPVSIDKSAGNSGVFHSL